MSAAAGDDEQLLLVNPSAGAGRSLELLGAASAALDRNGVRFRTVMSESLRHGRELAREAAARGETVIVMSGDGLIGQVGGELAGSDSALAIIPGGRGNDLARTLGIPPDPVAAAAVVAERRTRRLDVGRVGEEAFLGIASCGFDSDANRIANSSRLVRGRLVYSYAALRALARWRPAGFELRLDGEPVEMRGYSVAVANSRAYGGGMLIAPDAELDDGCFDVVLTADMSRLRFLANLPKVFGGTHVSNPRVSVRRAASVEIAADRPFGLYADGDLVAELPARVTIEPAALSVIAP